VGWLAQRYRVVWNRGALERQGFLAGSDQRRLDELNDALRDPTARVLVAARGGYGATRICHQADFQSLTRHPKWCIGFSDFTAVHLEAARVGVSSIHAPNLTSLGRADARTRNDWVQATEAPLKRRSFEPLEVLAPGSAAGTLIGGNLSLLFSSAASGRLALPAGCLLFLEEINEAPYRIDRMLTSLLIAGHLRGVAGICVGDLTDDPNQQQQQLLIDVVRERLSPLGIPILARLPIGHGVVNRPLPLGLPAVLSSQPARLIVNPAPTEDATAPEKQHDSS
jgi:muramoyltetrapeptide carboxypeptidase